MDEQNDAVYMIKGGDVASGSLAVAYILARLFLARAEREFHSTALDKTRMFRNGNMLYIQLRK